MMRVAAQSLGRCIDRLRAALGKIEVLALFPLLTLTALWLGMADIVLLSAFLLPALLAVTAFGKAGNDPGMPGLARGDLGGPRGLTPGRSAMLAMLERISRLRNYDTACLLIQIDDWPGVIERFGAETAEDIAQRVLERLGTSLRSDDLVARLGDARFGIVLHPIPAARLGVRDGIVSRINGNLGEPMAIGGTAVRLTLCAGHTSLNRTAADPAQTTLSEAEAALSDALRNGPGAVRAYAPGLIRQRDARVQLSEDVEGALSAGELHPWFQPQVCTDTGVISGFEALARWQHPERGLLHPGDFLEAIDDAGRMEALGQSMLSQALTALRDWDSAGLRVPSVSVNFSATELRNTGLADRVKWEIDRFDLRPGRLTVEILETVAAEASDEAVIASLTALGAHGVNLDLDDFGIGQASLSAIRRFGVNRIKIDRSFIHGLDRDPELQAMVAAILSMARHLGVETLAEGVERAEEQTVLAQMGCDHLQGFHIARPMPFDETISWATEHNERIARAPFLGRRVG